MEFFKAETTGVVIKMCVKYLLGLGFMFMSLVFRSIEHSDASSLHPRYFPLRVLLSP
jgi:hypothetical protein